MRPILAALAVVALSAPAHAFMASNGLRVDPQDGTTFNVPYRGLGGATDFWCAAGEYVTRGLGLLPTTRVYRVSPPPRRSGEGIAFSLSPENATEPGIALLGSPDRGMSAAMADSFCQRLPRFFSNSDD